MNASSCLFIGPFPPPVHGQSVATRDLADWLETDDIRIVKIDSKGSAASKVAALPRLCARIFFGPEPSIYLSVNANNGIFVTAIYARAARMAGKRLFLHHHSYRYIGSWDASMSRLGKAAGDRAVHITNCPEMGRELAERYPTVGNCMSLHNAGSVEDTLQPEERPDRPITIGHMSNLTEAKGVGRVVEAFGTLKKHYPDARLVVAGPAAEAFARDTIENAQTRFGNDFSYLGSVYGEQKKAFFRAIDIFAFPSLYRVETQGIVNLEALASGKLVAAFDQCCIGSDIGEKGGVAIPKGEDFATGLIRLAETASSNWSEARLQARARFEELRDIFERELRMIVSEIGAV